ncbi:efflux RND transporter periplasmic adaptor subunit [Chelatococcus sp. SYSU_G07232]|uniref:Efflux RND transporter periplasmic adaptor subunit n=1 Tax=Chelatococcus albus TaxID=3047466 RepID=A0ABT7AGX3_9HYPH|nr:efflux RND transporter periplasmic adaptor subunit [Chelatococcus sp. SYSU_G07232]MDJ1158626.1 efflux RND transporter periplasmic adaptor subunit [Chelatococcus sp. SYSU_G07232]
MRRVWIVGGAAVAAGLLAVAFGWSATREANGAAYRTAPVDRGTIVATVKATGTLTPVTTVLVGSQLSGQIVEILADYNSPVKAGQVVARLYSEQIRTRRDAASADLAQGEADVAQRRAQRDRARATRQRSEAALQDLLAQRDRVVAQLTDARRTYERQKELFERGTGSQSAYDSAKTQADVQAATLASTDAQIASARAELVGQDADIALAEAQLKSAEAVVLARRAKLRDIEIDLERTEIRSPVDGVVVQRQIDLGQTVAASLNAPTLFTIAQDLHQIDIYANIDESDVGRIREGQRVIFTVNAYPNRTYEGRVRMVRLGAQTIQNVVTYTGVIGVDNADLSLLPGMTANLQIVTDERRDVLRVPNAALRFKPVTGATADAPSAGAKSPVRVAPLQELRERIAAEVKPTPDEAKAIEAILDEARRAAGARAQELADEERRAALRAARQDLMDRIAAALTPERRARFEALARELRAERAAGGGTGTRGRVHVLDRVGEPKAVPLRLGATDGSYTELLGGDIAEGAAVVVGGGPKPAAEAAAAPARGPRGPRLF